ncbi:hypothetical protein P3X46_014983 [Hevea brasiliensis]|uniref:Meiosis-specific protein ASY3-like coiled-coil domain-containing protein n=1 Tax=Hevea brasiliensis TaxID=3981 RepID=A0ABQ9LUG0_HEVBR|nr:hypothetical protein P3X46_014983 [Hevea brasiliensis]
MIDLLAKKRSEASKEDEIIASNAERKNCIKENYAERKNSNKENYLENKNKGKDVIDASERKQTEAPEIATSPWITTRSFHQKTSTSQTLGFAIEGSNLPATSERRKKFSRAQDAPVTHSVKPFANEMSVLCSAYGMQKKFDGLTYERKGGRDGNSQREDEFRFVTAQEVLVSDKAVAEDNKEDRRTKTLRMILWEILGTFYPPRSQPSNSQARDADAVSGGFTISKRKKGRRKSSGIEPHRIHFTDSNNTDEIQAATHRSEMPPPAETEKASSLSDKMGNFHGFSPQSKGQCIEQKNTNQEGDSHQSPRKDSHRLSRTNRVDLQGDFSSPAVPENEDQKGDFGNPSLKYIMERQDEFQSPTFNLNTPILNSSPSSTPKADQIERTVYGPSPAEGRFTVRNIPSFRTLRSSKADCHSPNAKTESSVSLFI